MIGEINAITLNLSLYSVTYFVVPNTPQKLPYRESLAKLIRKMVEMWNEVEWMLPADFAIMRLLDGDLALTPNNIAFNTNFNPQYVGRRCRELHRRGVLSKTGNGDPFYTLTELGERAIRNQISASEFLEQTRLDE